MKYIGLQVLHRELSCIFVVKLSVYGTSLGLGLFVLVVRNSSPDRNHHHKGFQNKPSIPKLLGVQLAF